MQPVSNQYNITDKIIEANQQLYSAGESARKTQPKVRFRDQKLVDYESEGMDSVGKDQESSDDGYIDDELPEATTSIEEVVEIEDVCETIEQLVEASENVDKETLTVENYSQEDFNEDEDDVEASTLDDTLVGRTSIDTQIEKLTKPEKSMKQQILHTKPSKVTPSEFDEKKSRKTCCQFKGTDEYKQKLPKYNGFNSHYGLSKEEIAKRELIHRKQSQYREFKHMQQAEQKEFLAGINEEAFAKW